MVHLLFALTLWGGGGFPGQDEEVRAIGFLHPQPARIGMEVSWEIIIDLPEGWHINGEKPLDDFLVPTLFSPSEGAVDWGKVQYPKPVSLRFGWSDDPVLVYEGEVVLIVNGVVVEESSAVLGTLEFQACTDRVCFPPTSLEVETGALEWSPDAVGMSETLLPHQSGKSEEMPPQIPVDDEDNHSQVAGVNRTVAPSLWVLFLAGLALAFSPCIYPILPIILLSLSDGNKGWGALKGGIPFVFGLVGSYAVVGGVAASLGLVAGAVLQSEWVGWGLVLLFGVMGVVMLTGWTPHPGTGLSHAADWLRGRGKVGMGAALGVAAAPCTAPVLASASGAAAASGSLSEGLLLFGTLGLGMSLPLLGFAVAGAQLPKGGAWLMRLKKFMGVALLGYAAFLGWARVDTGEGTVPPPLGATVYYISARWCIPCWGIKRNVLTDPTVQEVLEGWDFVTVDLTEESEDERALREKYGVNGVPALIVVPYPDQPATFIHEGEFGVEEIVEALEKW
ncbi:sulfite exporter TauE/SafE family protein [bacterium]|nr:sulfite exporter TauE/SafE family protein [bacterium]